MENVKGGNLVFNFYILTFQLFTSTVSERV